MSSELVVTSGESFMPALSITEAVQRRVAIVEFVREVMIPGVDFGCIPGTPKPTLLKPGAEKLCTLFGLTTRFQIIHSVEDWTGEQHGGEPFFYYLYRCQLWRDAHLIAEGDGSCNSFEQKYRWRDAQRLCPHCGKTAIIKGKAEYGGGWLCFVKKGGCGARFLEGDLDIESQPIGRVPNPDVADQVNTLQKMAQKRALVAATLLAVNASEFFTQDEEERLVGPASEFSTPQTGLKTSVTVIDILPATAADSASSKALNRSSTSNEATPLIVVEFEANISPQAGLQAGIEAQSVEPGKEHPLEPMTAALARAAFEQKAREQFSFVDKRGLALLAVALLGGKPERWILQAWQTATHKPESAWRDALRCLQEQDSTS